MADARLTPQVMTPGSVAPSYTAIVTANTYQVRNGGYTLLHFLKTGAGVATITVVTPNTVGGLAIAERTISVPATTGDKIAGPFPMAIYNNGDEDIEFTTNDESGLTCAVFQLR